MVDVLTAGYFDNGTNTGATGGAKMVEGFASSGAHSDREVNDLTWQALDGFEDNSSGVGSSSGGAEEYGTASSPLRRKSYLWKRPAGKSSGVGGAAGGQGGVVSSNALLRARSVVETTAAAVAGAHENGLANGNRRGTSGAFFAERREGIVRALPPSVTAGRAGGTGGVGENEQPGPEKVLQGSGVELEVGVTDGGEDHRFKVRGASFALDGLEVRKARVSIGVGVVGARGVRNLFVVRTARGFMWE